jgi:flagellar assembly factor FliW
MKFTLKRFGAEQIDIDPQSIITFPIGIPPFDNCTHYKLFHEEGKTGIFWLQSLDDADLLFSITDPDLLKVSYEVTLNEDEQSLLKVATGDELQLAVIVYQDDEATEGSLKVNTRAPIILNLSKRLGLQKLLHDFETEVSIKGN